MNTLSGVLPAARLLIALLIWVPISVSAQVAVTVSFDASAAVLTNPERAQITSHAQAAGFRWGQMLGVSGPRNIEVQIGIAPISTANGASLTTVFVGIINGRDTFEQGVAHELRTGIDPNLAEADAQFNFGLTYLRNELWFDPDPFARIAPVPIDRTDAMGVFLHEFGHAIAYNGWANGQGVPPATFWSPFDRWMQPGTPTLFQGPAAVSTWGSAPDLTTGNIMHWGNSSKPLQARFPAPRKVEWRNGAPVPHLVCDDLVSADLPDFMRRGSPPPGLLGQLMNGVVIFRGTRYDISALDLATLADVGLPNNNRLFASGFETP